MSDKHLTKTTGQLLDEYAGINCILYDVERKVGGFAAFTDQQRHDAREQGREIQNRIRRDLVTLGALKTINDSIPDLAKSIGHVYKAE